jgi:hypothetical protein
MTALDDSGGEVDRRDLTEELIDELTADTAAGTRAESLVTEFLLELRSQYGTPAEPDVRAALAEFVDVDLSNRRDLPSRAGSPAPGTAAHPPVLPAWEPTTTTRRIRVLSSIATFLGTVTGKIVLGATVATATVSGAQATGVVDIPTLPSSDDEPGVVETDDGEIGDVNGGREAEIDDGEVGDVDDGQVGDIDDGKVGVVDDGPEGEGEVEDGPDADVQDGSGADVNDGQVTEGEG